LADHVPPAQEPARSVWARWFGRRPGHLPAAPAGPLDDRRRAAERVETLLQSILTGYTMSVQRLDRALAEHGLEAIACVGRPFDPETMEVVEAVPDSGRAPGEVVEELRRGYLWNGRVFRYALVRVAK